MENVPQIREVISKKEHPPEPLSGSVVWGTTSNLSSLKRFRSSSRNGPFSGLHGSVHRRTLFFRSRSGAKQCVLQQPVAFVALHPVLSGEV